MVEVDVRLERYESEGVNAVALALPCPESLGLLPHVRNGLSSDGSFQSDEVNRSQPSSRRGEYNQSTPGYGGPVLWFLPRGETARRLA